MTELPHSTWSGAAPGTWLARWLAACADLEDLFAHHNLLDAIIEEIDGRRIRVGERWLIDFASCNYLGLDLDREVIEAIPAYLDRWGTHPSWSRMLGSPALYRQIETRLTELLGAGDTLLLPTLTHIHASVIPVLASDGTIFVDSRAHKTIWDGCVAARAHGATVVRYAHDDPQALERLLRRHPKAPRLVCMDGINSMTGNPPDLPAFLALARANDALLYVDDAHGFGVVGERDREEISPYGRRGNGVVRHLGERYDHIVLTGGFSKAYSSLLAFIACPPELKRLLKITAPRTCTRARPRWRRWPACSSGSRSTRPEGTSCGPSSGPGPGASWTTWRSWGRSPSTAPGSRSSRCPWPTRTTWPGPGASSSTGASTSPWPSTRACPARRSGSASR